MDSLAAKIDRTCEYHIEKTSVLQAKKLSSFQVTTKWRLDIRPRWRLIDLGTDCMNTIDFMYP